MKPRITCFRCAKRVRLIGYRTLCRDCRLRAYIHATRKAAATVARRKGKYLPRQESLQRLTMKLQQLQAVEAPLLVEETHSIVCEAGDMAPENALVERESA